MPKIYKYYGMIFMFYSKEHLPIHIHGRKAGRESKAEIIFSGDEVQSIKIKNVEGRAPLLRPDKEILREVAIKKAADIKAKWIGFHIEGKHYDIEEIYKL